jgi:hypothetical protein
MESVPRPGVGIVLAATRTESASFAMVRLEENVNLLAVGAVSQDPRIDDIVRVMQESDGTFSFVPEQEG